MPQVIYIGLIFLTQKVYEAVSKWLSLPSRHLVEGHRNVDTSCSDRRYDTILQNTGVKFRCLRTRINIDISTSQWSSRKQGFAAEFSFTMLRSDRTVDTKCLKPSLGLSNVEYSKHL